jgi:hypothetical protein
MQELAWDAAARSFVTLSEVEGDHAGMVPFAALRVTMAPAPPAYPPHTRIP